MKDKKGPQIILIIIFTVVLTLIIQRAINKADEIDYFATRLTYKEDDKTNATQVAITQSLSFNDILECTVGISPSKASGAGLLSLNAEEKWGMGTGIIVSENGYILTNEHLVNKVGASVVITLNSGNALNGQVVWSDKNLDLAIVKVNEGNLKSAVLGDSDQIELGKEVYAVGNPLGAEFSGSITKGIISGTDRTILFDENDKEIFMEGLIQTDASINPGNSGGPLINSNGEVIGINTVKITTAEGIGFALPVNVVKNVIKSFEETGSFEEAHLGLYAYDSNVGKYIETPKTFDEGVYIVEVVKDGPCSDLGIKKGDILVSIDGIKIDRMIKLREYLYSKKPGDEVRLVVNDGSVRVYSVILD